MPKHAAQADANQREIILALKQMGAKAIYLKKPVDLLVGYRGVNVLLEVKNLSAARGDARQGKLTAEEQEFFDTWPGQVEKVTSPQQACEVVVDAWRRSLKS